MRHAVLVALLVLPACGFSAPGGTQGNVVADDAAAIDSPEAPMTDAPMIDAMMIDAAPDAPPDAPPMWTTVDTLTVPCVGNVVTSTFVLQQGVMYKLRGVGECITNTFNGSRGDAEYTYNNGNLDDSVNNVDGGIAVNDTTPGMSKNPRWGAFASSHQYEVMWPGAGATITTRFHSSDYSNNSGSLILEIQALQ